MKRQGGLSTGIDPDVAAWQQRAARNVRARTPKQKYDAQRIRLRLDVPRWLKEALANAAADEGTSANQLGAYLVSWGLYLLATDTGGLRANLNDCKRKSSALKIDFDVQIPEEIEEHFTA